MADKPNKPAGGGGHYHFFFHHHGLHFRPGEAQRQPDAECGKYDGNGPDVDLEGMIDDHEL